MLRHTRVNLGQVATYQTDRVARTPQTCSSIFISIALQHLKDSRGGEIKEHCWFPPTKKKHAPLLYAAVNWLQEPGSDKSIHYHMSEKAAAALVWGSGDSSNLFPLKYRQAPQVSPGTASAFFFFFFLPHLYVSLPKKRKNISINASLRSELLVFDAASFVYTALNKCSPPVVFFCRKRRTAAIWASVCLARRLLSVSKSPWNF